MKSVAITLTSAFLLATISAAAQQPTQPQLKVDSSNRTLTVSATDNVTVEPDLAILHIGFVTQPQDAKSAYADGTRAFEISSFRTAGGGTIIARLRGIPNRTEAEKLGGIELYILREALPPAEDDEFYHSDLIGLPAFSPEGEPLGEIIAVHNFGAGDLLELRAPGSRYTELIPFEQAHVPKIDLKARRVTIVKPLYHADGNTEPQ